jgi:hypothetical protein
MREIAGEMKVSLHESGECSAAMTMDFIRDDAALVAAMGGTRHFDQWTRTPQRSTSLSIPLQVAFPASELRAWHETSDFDGSITWIAPPPARHSVIVSCIFSRRRFSTDDWPRKDVGARVVASYPLPNGEHFWIIYEVGATSNLELSMLEHSKNIRKGRGLLAVRDDEINSADAPRVLMGNLVPEGTLVLVDGSAEDEPEP